MKSIILLVIIVLTLSLYSCGSDSTTGGGPIGPGGGGAVTFTMSGQGDINNYNFGFKPSVDVKISRIVASVQGFADTVASDPNYVYSKDTTYSWYGYSGVQQGQAWTFTFTGSLVSNNQAYTVNSGFTIP